MVGILEDERDGCGLHFPEAGLEVVLLGETSDELGGSEWQQLFLPDALAAPPHVDLDREKALIELLLAMHGDHMLRSAHDVSNGGLAVALAECSAYGVGCEVELAGHADALDAIAILFSESQGRAVVTCAAEHLETLLGLAGNHDVPARRIGRTKDDSFTITRNRVPLISTTTAELARIWRPAFAMLLGGDTIDDVVRGVGEAAPEIVAH
ncbi:MAG TPA: AIR synthase-related protein [Thermoanaerobaculia bacterium]|nr:AIR synthase-related protein [Thermoanaerobaculia bacterium]